MAQTDPKDPAQPAEGSRASELIKLITADVKELVADEVALAKAELKPAGKFAGIGGGAFGAAGYFALNGISLWFLAAIGFLVMGLLVLLVAGGLALFGKSQFDKVKGPEAAISNGKAVVKEAQLALSRANARAQTAELEVKSFDHPDLKNPGNLR